MCSLKKPHYQNCKEKAEEYAKMGYEITNEDGWEMMPQPKPFKSNGEITNLQKELWWQAGTENEGV